MIKAFETALKWTFMAQLLFLDHLNLYKHF